MTAPVLALRALGLGDALTAVPALRGLRRLAPDRPLLLAGPAGLGGWLAELGIVDDVVPVAGLSAQPPGRALGSHVAVNLHGRGPDSHRLLQESRPTDLLAFDCPAASHHSRTRWRSDEHEVDRWCRLVNAAGGHCTADDLRVSVPGVVRDDVVVLHPGAAAGARRWPIDRWTAVARELRSDGADLVLTGTERELCRAIARQVPANDASGDLPIGEFAGLVARAGLVLSTDTGIAHLATATGTRSVTLFGPTPPAFWGPAIDSDLHTVVHHGTGPGDPHAARTDEALLRISVQEVLTAARAQRAGTIPRSS
ncbi:glycosyltransferase family 9 protein [Kribbella turkmenica]|uniref:Glycosyltransferase family 9 protein n=1 Tax=Kribbella turkmenica TaxID=2530375 RepID=A0A4V2YFM5_9ACTN|nr:glycosyltransferase family 9 protein [Kribbella turkmenica]TDD23747.1 glycosyltransferase family 9 protein [Kribbella turkmenica]